MPKLTSRPGQPTEIGSHLPETYFRQTRDAFARALANADSMQEVFFELAGVKICLCAAGDMLLPRITATLAHLQIPRPDSIDFTICCWDEKTARTGLPLPTPSMMAHSPYFCVSDLTNERYRTFVVQWMRILSCVDLEERIAYCRYEDVDKLLMYEISGPLRPVFNVILNRRGMQLIHASSIGTSRGSVIFAGAPGSGKSTIAVMCLQNGLSYQSDDICVLSSEDRPRSFSIYNIAKLREDVLPRFAPLQPLLSHFQEEDGEKKAFFYVHQHFPHKVLREAPVRALVLPHVAGTDSSRLERAMPRDAVRAVTSWTLREIPKSDSLSERIMLQAVARLPAYHLHLGSDAHQTLTLIGSLLNAS